MFKLTDAAAAQIQEAARAGGTEGQALRLAARRLQDGSIDYRIGFDDPGEEDIRLKLSGVSLLMSPEDAPLLDQATMDYVELNPGEFRFIFLNPKDPGFAPPVED